MAANTLKRNTSNKKRKTVGRGGTRGKTAGRGTKGQKARAGHRIRPHIRDIIKKLPKLRGRGKNSNKAFRTTPEVVNLSMIDKAFAASARVTPSTLLATGLIVRANGVLPAVKVLAEGDLTKKLSFYDCQVSESAKKKIVAAGGSVH
jgi:large subunit ribosomal protein L15